MSVLVAVLVVGLGSMVLRVAPLLVAHRVPDRVARVAGWAGLAVLTAIVVRTVLVHQDVDVPGARAVAAVAVGGSLVLAYRGWSLLTTVAVGASTYLVLSLVLFRLT